VIFKASKNDLIAIKANIKLMFVEGARMLDAVILCSANRIKRFISEQTQDIEQSIATNQRAFEKKRLEIVEKYCAKNEDGTPETVKSEDGKTIETKIIPEKLDLFNAEYKLLADEYAKKSESIQAELDQVVEIEYVPIDISLFEGKMLPHEAAGLEPFIEIK
jgi:hypothetical protein